VILYYFHFDNHNLFRAVDNSRTECVASDVSPYDVILSFASYSLCAIKFIVYNIFIFVKHVRSTCVFGIIQRLFS